MVGLAIVLKSSVKVCLMLNSIVLVLMRYLLLLFPRVGRAVVGLIL